MFSVIISFLFFSYYLFEYFFSPAFFLFSFHDCDNTNAGSFVIIPQVSEALFVFHLIFFLLFRLGNIIVLSSTSLILPSVFSILLLSWSDDLFILFYLFFNSKFSLQLLSFFHFFPSSISLLRLSLFLIFGSIMFCLLKLFFLIMPV